MWNVYLYPNHHPMRTLYVLNTYFWLVIVTHWKPSLSTQMLTCVAIFLFLQKIICRKSGLTTLAKNRETWLLPQRTWGRSEGMTGRLPPTSTCFIQKIYAPSSSLLQGKHLPVSPSPLRLNIFSLFVIFSLTQWNRYTPEIFLFTTATFKYTYRALLRRIGQEYQRT